jgi:hypothetical protein
VSFEGMIISDTSLSVQATEKHLQCEIRGLKVLLIGGDELIIERGRITGKRCHHQALLNIGCSDC